VHVLAGDAQPGDSSPHAGATYELVGTPAMSQNQVANILAECLGRPVHAEQASIEDWVVNARTSGMGEYTVDTLVKMFEYYEMYGFMGNTNVLNWLMNRPATSLEVFVKRAVEERLTLAI
jgi:hypothetical protein